MSYMYRKPKNAEEAIELTKLANVEPKWVITYRHDVEMAQKYFAMYEPILFIYKNDKLVGGAHNKFGEVQIFDLDDRIDTQNYSVKLLAEIDVNLKQIELF
jgi:hypothetical protein